MSTKLTFEIQGDKAITDQYVEDSFTVTGKSEQNFYAATVTDSWINIPITKVGDISKIIANSTSANIRITYLDGTSKEIIIPIDGLFVCNVGSAFADIITAIDVSTDETQATDIEISVIGE